MSDETTLLPCPFCGGEAHVVSDYSSEHDETRWSLWHECCEHDGESAGYGHALFPWFETPWYKTEAEAITAWNTRTDYHGYEQAAIEAWKSIKAWNTRATHGTLTAEQVREAVEASTWAETSTIREFNDSSWQAIADELNAELESDDDYERKMDELLCRLTNGKWSKSRAYSIEFMVSCVDEEYEALYSEEQFSASVSGTLTAEQVREIIYKHGVNDGSVYSVVFNGSFKAIADELNAELGSGTCKQEERGWSTEGDHARVWLTCGHDCMVPTVADLPNFCPVCGKAVKR